MQKLGVAGCAAQRSYIEHCMMLFHQNFRQLNNLSKPTIKMHLLTLSCCLLLYTIASVIEGSPAFQGCSQENGNVMIEQAAKTWPKEIIPYEISNQLSGVLRRNLLSAMQAKESSSCTIFTPHSNETDFVSFESGVRCCSNNGYMGHGRQDVLIGKPCMDSGSEQQLSNIIHMLVGGDHKSDRVVLPGANNTVKRQVSEESQTFSANINKNCNAVCGGYALLDPVTESQRESFLATPDYPQQYSTHLDCTWKLEAPEGHALRLNFHDLDLEAHRSCKHDYINVQYLDKNGRLLRSSKWCGSPDIQTLNQPTLYDVNTSIVIVQFHSDSSYGGRGLLLGYTTKERPVNIVDPCSVNNGGCVHVCTSDAFGEHVCSCKSGFRLTRKGRCLDNNECKVNNGGCEHKCTNTKGSFSCHCHIGYVLSTDQISCHTCNFTFVDRSGSIYPTGYPVYTHSQNCLWSLQSWPGHHLKITISHFDTITSERCSEDYLKIAPSNFPYQGRLCGYHSHIEYYVQGKITLRFRSKQTNSWHSGFSLTYKQTLSSQLDDNALHNVNVDGKNVPSRKRVWS